MPSRSEGSERKKRRGPNRTVQGFSRYYSLAFEMAIAVIAPTLLGRWLDTRTGKEPWFTIGGVILGGAAAVRSAQRAYAESMRELKRDKNSSSEADQEEETDT